MRVLIKSLGVCSAIGELSGLLSSGSFAMLAAIRRASSLVMRYFAAEASRQQPAFIIGWTSAPSFCC